MNHNLKYIAVLMVLLSAGNVYSINDDFLSLASASWKKTREVYLQTELEIVMSRDDIKHDPKKRDFSRTRTELFRLGSDQSLGFVHLDNEDGSEMQNVYVQNPQYGFELARGKDSESWQLMSIVSRDAGVGDWYQDASIAPWSIISISLIDAIEDPSFRLISVVDEVGSGGDCKVIAFDLNSSEVGLIGKLRSCKLRVCAERGYIVDAFDANFESEGGGFRGVGECAYDGEISGVPRLQSYVYNLTRANKKNIVWTHEITRLSMCTKSKNDFKLSAFGLTEPEQGAKTSPLVWIALLAIGLLGTGLLLRRFSN